MAGFFSKCKGQYGKKLLPFFCAAVLSVALSFLLEALGFSKACYSVFSCFLFVALAWVFSLLIYKRKPAFGPFCLRRFVFSVLIAFLFSLTMIVGYQLQSKGLTDTGFAGKLKILGLSALLTLPVYPFAAGFFKQVEKVPALKKGSRTLKAQTVFFVSAAVIFLCLIPVWLAYYPIVMSYDFHRQINEANNGFAYFYPYQPIAHTWVIWVFYQLGQALGDLEAGMAGMALLQMALYALVCAYAVTFLYRVFRRFLPVILTTLFFALFPYNTVLVVCTTKDTLFTILFLLFTLLFLERSFFCTGKRKIWINALLVLEGCLMVQFRSNALYALAVFLILLFCFCPKKEKLEILLLCLLLIGGGKATGVAIKAAIGTELSSAKIEMYSVPIQQFARVGYTQMEGIDEEIGAIVDSYVPKEKWSSYNAPLADTIKGSLSSTDWFSHSFSEFLSDWIKVGLHYPNEYIDAFLELTRGYWFLDDTSFAENLGFGAEGRMGVIFTYTSSTLSDGSDISIEHTSKLPWLEVQIEKIVSCNCFYEWPILSLLFKSAFYPWLLLLTMAAYLYLKQTKQLLLGLWPTLYLATMFLGPVVQLRYLFPTMAVLPLLIGLLFLKNKEVS